MQFYVVPTANERKALWFLAFVALSGSAVRLWRAQQPVATPAESAALDRQIRRVDSARDRRPKVRESRPTRRDTSRAQDPAPESTAATAAIDLDRASETEIETLPGIGPALARRIVLHRDSAGPFGAVDALCDVRGIGPALVEKLRPVVTFTGPRRHVSATCGGASKKARKAQVARTRKPR